MIAANQERWPTELLAANNRAVDPEATDELDEDQVQGLLEEGQTVVSYAVRGPFVVVVSEDEDGNVSKEAFPRPGHEKQAERLAPKFTEKDAEKADKEARKQAEKEAKESDDEDTSEGAAEEPKPTATPAAARRR
jgi:hypothetical protein